MEDNFLKNKRIIISTHVHLNGPAQDLEKYLLRKVTKKILFMGHPLYRLKEGSGSFYKLYKDGRLVREKRLGNFIKPQTVASYVLAAVFNFIYPIILGRKWDLYVGSNNLNAFSGVFLRKIGVVKKVIFYTIDFSPKRFQNKILNEIYHYIDKFCVKNCDETWNLSDRMTEGRDEIRGIKRKQYSRQRLVPIGIWYDEIANLGSQKELNHNLFFIGDILEKQGLQHVFDAIPGVVKIIPDFKFIIVGGGTYLEKLKEIAQEKEVKNFVEFKGLVRDDREVNKIISRSSLAIAPYNKYDENGNVSFTYFADPSKLKIYLASGLPVLVTDVPYNARNIEKNRCGLVISTDKESIEQGIIKLMSDEKILKEYSQNALNYARKFNWPLIFQENLRRIL